jgi:integrase/recombinase XerC/integrase/recombinase XerD
MNVQSVYQLFKVDHEVYCSDKTIVYYDENVPKFIAYVAGELSLSPDSVDTGCITRNLVIGYQKHLRDSGIKNTSVNTYFRAAKVFLNYCIEEGYCSSDVLRKVKFLKSDQEDIIPLSGWEVDVIDGLFNYRTESGIRNLCIVHLMLDAGFRRSDVVALRYSNVNFQNNYLMVQGKGNKYRTIPLCPRLKKLLSHYMIKFRSVSLEDDFPVFVNVGTQDPIKLDCIKQLFVRIKKSSGIDRIHPHLLRHTFATSYMIGGGNIEFLRLMLGHEDYETTKIYLHLAQQSKMLNLSIYKLDPVFFKSGY